VTALTVLTSAGIAFGQDEVARKQALEVAARVPLEKPTTGAPYSAETLVEGLQVLADGNRIVRKTTGRVYRDGEGRTRREEDGPNGRVSITIVDPVGGYSYALDPESKTAWRTPTGTAAGIMEKLQVVEEKQKREQEQLTASKRQKDAEEATLTDADKIKMKLAAASAAQAGEVRMRAGADLAATSMENTPLEHKVIDGVNVEGRKTTRTIPAGKVGNEQPLTVTSEEWRSPDLGVLVLTRHSDPRTGESTYRLTNIIRAEPDRSLFIVPPDYTVKDTGVRRMVELSQKK
jgi:hypothetical protein